MTVMCLLLVSIYMGPAQADVDPGYCDTCHGITCSTEIGNCMNCHIGHVTKVTPDIIPSSPGPAKVHKIHNRLGYEPRKNCVGCHKPYDVIMCSDCHSTYTEAITINMTCTDCHNGLPVPFGHSTEREQLDSGNHSWMRECDVCHEGRNLHFSDFMCLQINDSLPLCSVCHSEEYQLMSSGEHGKSSDTCVDCHNPHDTKPPHGKDVSFKNQKTNISGIISAVGKMPVIGNPVLMLVILMVFISIIYEYKFATPESGKVLMANNIRLNADKDNSRALEFKLEEDGPGVLNRITKDFENKGVRIMGMTMSADPPKIVMFIDFSGTQTTPDELLESVYEPDGKIISADYSEKYEI